MGVVGLHSGNAVWFHRDMTSDLDIYRTANTLIKKHGDEAPIHAAMRADEMLEAGDLDGLAVWKRVLKAVDELLNEDIPDGTVVN